MSARTRRSMILLAALSGLGVAGAFLPVGHAEIDAQPTPTVSLEIRGSGAMGQLARAVALYLAVYLKPSRTAEEFVAFTLSKAGQEILAKDGLIPVH